jgi:hypothetical protein
MRKRLFLWPASFVLLFSGRNIRDFRVSRYAIQYDVPAFLLHPARQFTLKRTLSFASVKRIVNAAFVQTCTGFFDAVAIGNTVKGDDHGVGAANYR